jgi:N-acetylglucosaminyldiphosphoundecaprenol N-acetyl-beta-D-mannosaminyltransferase
MKVWPMNYGHVAEQVLQWSAAGGSRYVCVANVSSVMEAFDSPSVSLVMNSADLVTPDGMPLVWGLRALGAKDSSRVYGPDLTLTVLAEAERACIPVGFYGASQETLRRLLTFVHQRFPRLSVAYSCSPPFRQLSRDEDDRVTKEVNASGTRILFVGLGSPKQDIWMADHRGKISAVMLGVGAAFDFLSGTKPQAPRWMMRAGLEWLFRLATEPRRLWRRYLRHNPRFVLLFGLQLLGLKRFPV